MDKTTEFNNADDLCEWCVRNNYQVTDFNNIQSYVGYVIEKGTKKELGMWRRDRSTYNYTVTIF